MYILGEIDELYNFLDENLAQINMILGNRYAAVVRKQAEQTKVELQRLDTCLEEWINLMKQWMYLENIFKAGDVKKSLSQESNMFEGVDKFFRNLMKKVFNSPSARKLIGTPKIVDDLKFQNS